jgi:low temperature requirement protein LtrA
MTTGRLGVLRSPQQGRAAFLELFFDLVFVLAFFRLSQQLLEHLSWTGALQTLVLLLAVFAVWLSTARFLDAFDPQHPLVQLAVMPIIFGTLVMAAATPEAFGPNGLVFAATYLTIRVGGLATAIYFLRGHEGRDSAVRLLVWVGLATVPWIAGALVPGWPRAALWTMAVAVEYVGVALGFPTPRLGRSGTRRQEVVVSEDHMAERYQQFFIVVLGEPILVAGLTFADGDFTAARTAATLVAFTTTALLWRIYIHRAGARLAAAMAEAPDPRRITVLTTYGHAIMAAGVITIAVADELVIQHPLGHTEAGSLAIILGGPALFLVGRATFEYAVFGRVSRPRVIGALALLAAIPAMRLVPPLAVATAATVILAGVATLILAGIAASDAARTRRLPPEPPSPPAKRIRPPDDRGGRKP